MEERKEIIGRFVAKGMKVEKATSIGDIPKSTYYYRSNGRKKGKTPSKYTLKNGFMVDNAILIKEIESILGHEFNDYGYLRTTMELQNRGFIINKKKVYRIMKENNWLFPIKKKKSLDKAYVKYTSPLTDYPCQVVEIDIKYMYIHGTGRNAYLITLLDTFSRTALDWVLEYNMKAQRAMELIQNLVLNENFKTITQITIRSDNGSQFIAKAFRELLKEHNINHEYIHPGTPEENGHIESFHNTVEKSVCNKYCFEDIFHAREILERFYDYYNNERIMKSILYQSPNGFLSLWNEGKVGIKRMNKKQIFFFREKPRINGASLLEDFCTLSQSEVKKDFVNCITTS